MDASILFSWSTDTGGCNIDIHRRPGTLSCRLSGKQNILPNRMVIRGNNASGDANHADKNSRTLESTSDEGWWLHVGQQQQTTLRCTAFLGYAGLAVTATSYHFDHSQCQGSIRLIWFRGSRNPTPKPRTPVPGHVFLVQGERRGTMMACLGSVGVMEIFFGDRKLRVLSIHDTTRV